MSTSSLLITVSSLFVCSLPERLCDRLGRSSENVLYLLVGQTLSRKNLDDSVLRFLELYAGQRY
jgi:hypothetical protein